MRIAYLDTVGGIAGDMTMAAFVSAGISIDELSQELRKLPLGSFELVAQHVQRHHIDAVHIDVVLSEESRHRRHLNDIYSIIEGSTFSDTVKRRAKSIFAVIAEAEAKIHASPIEKVHFHEVGALDSIIDIVGTAICFEKFGIEQVYSSPVRLGSGGFQTTQHGTMPTPVPATLEILKDYPVVLTAIPYELTTPTGAGIIKATSAGTLDEEIIRVHSVGYGAGSKEFAEIPNFLRVVIGEIEGDIGQEQIVVVETNIDDMNPQVYPYLIEKLLEAGAHDAYLIPIIMKKGRPGILLSVMVPKGRLDHIAGIIYQQTSTIGLRVQNIGRKKLPRREMEIETSFGRVKAKAVVRSGEEVITPEFEECKRIAHEKHIPLLEVMEILQREIGTRRQS